MNPGDFPAIDKKLAGCNKVLAKIEAHVAARDPRRPRYRNTPVFFSQQFVIPSTGLLATQDEAVVNNAEDCYLTGIGYGLYYANSATTPTFLTPMFDTGVFFSSGVTAEDVEFGFAWNFKQQSTGNWYRTNTMLGNAVSDLGACPHRSMGYPEQGKPMAFTSRLKFLAGDSLLVRMVPMSLQLFGSSAKLFHLSINFYGYRTEHLYEGY